MSKTFLEEVQAKDKNTLRHLLNLYLYDFSEYTNDDVNKTGEYQYKYFEDYFTEKERKAFFIRDDNQLAGFALIRKLLYDTKV